MRYYERLHHFDVPGPTPSYVNDVITDFWEGTDEPQEFEHFWAATESGPVWRWIFFRLDAIKGGTRSL